ncbi:MAG: SDR family oxidoreductase [Phycisphaerales bacterium]|nr:SDR family oxidoreductase [Phycisphaerales bacterium]
MNANATKSAIITGAGSGVGQALALLLAESGYELLLAGRTTEKLEQTAQLIHQTSPRLKVISHQADIAEPATCKAIIDNAMQQFGRIDALINVAGYASMVPIEKITPQEWRTTLDINLSSVIYLTTAAWPIFKQQKAGFIANVSSMASISPFPGFALYALPKPHSTCSPVSPLTKANESASRPCASPPVPSKHRCCARCGMKANSLKIKLWLPPPLPPSSVTACWAPARTPVAKPSNCPVPD